MKKAGLSAKLRFHDLRHIAAYWLGEMIDVMTEARILGHCDIKTTMRYLFSTGTDKRLAMEKSWQNLFSFVDQSYIGEVEKASVQKQATPQSFNYQ